MSSHLLIVSVLVPTVAVVVAMLVVMWAARTTPATARAAILAGIALAGWAVTVTVLGLRGAFVQADSESIPPIGMVLLAAFVVMGTAFRASASLRSLFRNQQHLIRLNVWRLEGAVFLLLMLDGQMPALWALPAGIGDLVVGTTAFWVARRLPTPSGKGTAVVFHLWGLVDLVVAVGLGMTTSPGPLQIFQTVPTSELIMHFPLVLVPTFLVPLAFALHVISLTQLLGGYEPSSVGAGGA
jgi:hypothetical protein